MKTKFKAEDPDGIEFTLTVTLTLHDWKVLQSQLSERLPSWQLSGAISDMVNLAQSSFYPKELQ